MVGNLDAMVGFDKETVAFIKAVEFVKKQRRLYYKDISEKIGLTKEQGEQIRAGRRRASNEDIANLIKHYPDSVTFFVKPDNTTSEHSEIPPEQTLNEPMQTRFYGKQPDHRDELVELQKKMIAKLELELTEVKEKLKVVEAERKTLIDIVSNRK